MKQHTSNGSCRSSVTRISAVPVSSTASRAVPLGVASAAMGNEFGVLLLCDVDESFHWLFCALVGSQGRRSIDDKGIEVFFYKNEGMVVKGGV